MTHNINEKLDELSKKIEGLVLFLEENPQFTNDPRIISLRKKYKEELKNILKNK